MDDGQLMRLVPHASITIADVQCEKIAQREAQVIETELKAIAPTRKSRVIIDLAQVEMVASMGLGMLVTMHKTCAQAGGKLVICGLKPDLLALLKITHLDRVLTVVKTRDDAVKTLG
jgi:anti-sigma B factor antagonist